MNSISSPTPKEKESIKVSKKRTVSIGFPTPSGTDSCLKFFPMTPESAEILVERGFDIIIEEGFGKNIKYSDENYARRGVRIGSRADTFGADSVVYFPRPTIQETLCLKKNSLLLSYCNCRCIEKACRAERELWKILNDRNVTCVDLDLLCNGQNDGEGIYRGVLDMLSGRAAILKAAGILADNNHGKGIFLGGLPGIPPCETVIIGSSAAGVSAAKTALGMGSIVKCFDKDVNMLKKAYNECNERIMTSVYLPKVLISALREADIVIYNEHSGGITFNADVTKEMKKGVLVFNLGSKVQPFEDFINVDLTLPTKNISETNKRKCYTGAAASVSRSAAMALANETVNLFSNLDCEFNPVSFNEFVSELSEAVLTFGGKIVNPDLARRLDTVSINLMLLLQTLY